MGGLLWALFIGLGGLPYSQLIQILGSGTRTALWLAFAQAVAAVIQTVTGSAPLTLTNAVHRAIQSLTQYGLCTQSTTPTPSAPVDIMCNNGALRVNRLDLNNVNDGHYWSATGVYTSNASSRLSNTIPVKHGDVIAVTTEVVGTGSSLNIRYNQFNASGEWVSQSVYEQSSNAPHTEYITIGQDGFFNFSGNYTALVSMYVDWSKVLIINTTDPVFADGTDEVLTISAISSIQSENIVDAKGLDSRTGIVVSNSDRCYTRLGYYHAGATIVQRATDNKLGGYLYMYSSDTPSTESFIGVESMSTAVEVDGWYERSATSTSDGYLFIQSLANKSASLGINWSATQPSQTVTDIPMLLSVGDTKDEVEIISGLLTHRIGCHVFDGTETFSKSSAYGQAFLINAASASWGADRTASVLCTHFLGLPQTKSSQENNTCFFNQTGHFYFRVTDNSDQDAFKAWLAAEYAAGHPVIVWFVLAEETTEQGTPHSLHTVDGDNIVSWTYPGSTKTVAYAYQEPTNKVGTAKVGTAKAG